MAEEIRGTRHLHIPRSLRGADVFEPPPGRKYLAVDPKDVAHGAELIDLVSLRRDIEAAIRYARAYLATPYPESPGDWDVDDAFDIAAVVSYGRAFATGVRQVRIPLDNLNEDHADTHQAIIDLRNKFVAHSVNNFEQVAVYVSVTDNGFEPRQIVHVGQIARAFAPLTRDNMEIFIELCEIHRGPLQRRIGIIHNRIANELNGRGMDSVYALPKLVQLPPRSFEDLNKRRR